MSPVAVWDPDLGSLAIEEAARLLEVKLQSAEV